MKLKEGDVFSIPISNDEVGYGQIVNLPDKSTIIIAVFKKKNDKFSSINLSEIVDSDIIFLGYTLDAKLYHKHWVVVGNETSNLARIKLPFNKLGTPPDDIFITDYKGKRFRPATIEEFEKLTYQTTIAPIRYENALKAYYNFQEWKEDYDKILYSSVLKSNEVALQMN